MPILSTACGRLTYVACWIVTFSAAWFSLDVASAESPSALRVGIIGLDTSHAPAFTKLLNSDNPPPEVAGCRVVAAYPQGSPDIQSSVERVPQYTAELQRMGVKMVDSIEQLLAEVDVVLLETNDGRPHLEQLLPVLKSGKRTFVDKPMAGSLRDVLAMFAAAEKHNVAIFSSSSLRFGAGTLAARSGKVGRVWGCDTYSPCHLEPTHPDLFWYGIHGVEALFAVMGTGCEQVTRVHTDGTDQVTGVWKDGRVGTFRGMRSGKSGYGGMAFGEQGTLAVGDYSGYDPLVVEIVKFFRGGEPPVSAAETVELFAFMEAADESKRQGGIPVTLASVLEKARATLSP